MPTSKNAGCLGIFLRMVGISPSERTGLHYAGPSSLEDAPLPFRIRDDFLSQAETSFYHLLSNIVGRRAAICPKVRIIDILFVVNLKANYSFHNQVKQKHVDFLLCHPDTMHPLAALELDDSSHKRVDRMERDALVDSAFKAACLPLLRFQARRLYSQKELEAVLLPVLPQLTQAPSSPVDVRSLPASDARPIQPEACVSIEPDSGPETKSAPVCPKCGLPMLSRVSRRGGHTGSTFFGCINYPKCRETAPCRV